MNRGTVWTAAGGGGYAGKPRPVVVVQDDRFDATESITVVPLTTDPIKAPQFRVRLEPAEANGLRAVSHAMVDKITTMPKHRLRISLGVLSSEDMTRISRAIVIFLGIGG